MDLTDNVGIGMSANITKAVDLLWNRCYSAGCRPKKKKGGVHMTVYLRVSRAPGRMRSREQKQ